MYFDELKKSMEFIAKDNKAIFLGQAVLYPGTAMSNTLTNIPNEKKYEMPVNEDMQMGITNGLALQGYLPISIFPRWNFFLLATNQLINHLDNFKEISNGGYNPKVIIRTGIGSIKPLHPGHQHVGDFTDAYNKMLKNVDIIRLEESSQVFPAYQKAYLRSDGKSTILVEYGDYYNEK